MNSAAWTIGMLVLIVSIMATSGQDTPSPGPDGESAVAIIERILQEADLDTAKQKFGEMRFAPPGRYAFKENEFNALGYGPTRLVVAKRI